MILQAIAVVCLIVGNFFTLVAAIGLLRLPDLYTRMHAVTKAGTVGLGFILLAVCIHIQEISVTSRAIATLLFIMLTIPVAAHLLGRAMLIKKYKMWQP